MPHNLRVVSTQPPNPSGLTPDRGRLAATRFLDVRCVDVVGSTNTEMLAEARLGAPEGAVLVADAQTAGRGRLDRTWSAEPGTALLMSVLLRPQLSPERLAMVLMAVGLAAADAVEAAAGVRPGLKWPNDLVAADDRKLAGILAESVSGGATAIVAGIGINVAAGAYPAELSAQAVSCEEMAGRPVDRAVLLTEFLVALEGRYQTLLRTGGSEATVDAYRKSSATLGRRVRVELPAGTIEGLASHLAWNGQLVVLTDDGAHHPVSAGDIVHLRPTGN